MRIIKFILAGIFLLLSIAVSLGVIIAHIYGDDVKRFFVDEINRNVDTQVIVGDLSFSVLRRFPDASIEFKDVLVRPSKGYGSNSGNADTLFTASSLFLQFSILDLFRGSYNVNAIYALNGEATIFTSETGEKNYRFWKENHTEQGEMQIELTDVRLNDFAFFYQNQKTSNTFKGHINSLHLKGSFSGSASSFRVNSVIQSDKFSTNGTIYKRNHNIRAGVEVQAENGEFLFKEGIIDIDDVKLNVNGSYSVSDKAAEVLINGSDIEAERFLNLITEDNRVLLNGMNPGGLITLNGMLRIPAEGLLSPDLNLKIGMENGILYKNRREVFLSGIIFSGSFKIKDLNDPATSLLLIDSLAAKTETGRIGIKGSVKNLGSPQINLQSVSNLNLYEVPRFVNLPGIREINGNIEATLLLRGVLENSRKIDWNALSGLDLNGQITVRNGHIEVEHWKYQPGRINGKFILSDNITAENLDFFIDDDYFLINGEIENGLGYLLEKGQMMSFTGNIFIPDLNLDNYIQKINTPSQSNEKPTKPVFPENLEMNLNFETQNFNFRNFSASGVKGELTYKPRMFTVNSFDIASMGGSISGNAVIVQRYNDDFLINSQVYPRGVEIDKVFASFNNFNQNFIKDHNLRGRLTGSIYFASGFSPELNIISESTVAESYIEIESGELVYFEPLQSLSRFIEVSELQHIQFSTLKNEIFISNRRITIPQMDINSSAINISGSGIHYFDSEFEYRLRVGLSDVLYGRSRAARTLTPEFAVVEEHGRGGANLFLLVAGNSDDYEVSYDRQAAREALREQIRDERSLLKGILNQEFGWFSNDSSITDLPPKSESPSRFRIVWDEEVKQDTLKKKPPDKNGLRR